MAERTWLYIYEGAPRSDEEERRRVYIGIGKSMERVFEKHNLEAESLRNAEGTLIRQTVEPFSSRKDALKAEAIAIQKITDAVGQSTNPANYLIAQKYIQMLTELAQNNNQKTVYLPFEASNLMGSIGGIKDMFK